MGPLVLLLAVSCIRPENESYIEYERLRGELIEMRAQLEDMDDLLDYLEIRRKVYELHDKVS